MAAKAYVAGEKIDWTEYPEGIKTRAHVMAAAMRAQTARETREHWTGEYDKRDDPPGNPGLVIDLGSGYTTSE